jgi:hypothetical protein
MAVAALVALPTPAVGQSCIIVTNGGLDTYIHELAHCNGWVHAPFAPGLVPHSEFVRVYDGQLVIVLDANAIPLDTYIHAQTNAQIVQSSWTAAAICRELWRERNLVVTHKDVDRVIGCAVLDR